jgi:hypothetical protein
MPDFTGGNVCIASWVYRTAKLAGGRRKDDGFVLST